MRRYDEPVEVRRGPVAGWSSERGPAQFLWRRRLWKVRAVQAHWVETGPWWQHAGVRAVIGSEEPTTAGLPTGSSTGTATSVAELLVEREVWRVEAGPGGPGGPATVGGLGNGVFDLAHDGATGVWQLVGCTD